MNYSALRHLADSYGLLFLGITFLVLVGWAFRKGSSRDYQQARTMIFDDEDGRNG